MIDTKELVEKALAARINAYAPYSKFKVGCSLLLSNGKYILGSNIENASYGLTNCAERTALFKAISDGYTKNDIVAMAIIADTENPVLPCGACLQVITELTNKDTVIILANLKGDIKEVKISDLLPLAFKL